MAACGFVSESCCCIWMVRPSTFSPLISSSATLTAFLDWGPIQPRPPLNGERLPTGMEPDPPPPSEVVPPESPWFPAHPASPPASPTLATARRYCRRLVLVLPSDGMALACDYLA